MQNNIIISLMLSVFFLIPAQTFLLADQQVHPDYEIVKQIIYDSLGWAFNKDYDRLYSIWADDENIFNHYISSKSTLIGITAFKKSVEKLRIPDFKTTKVEYRDFRINFSRSGNVAWFSCYFDDCGEYKGQESCVINALKTGVLEKRDGKWVLVQSHSSYPVDKIPEDDVKYYYKNLFQDNK